MLKISKVWLFLLLMCLIVPVKSFVQNNTIIGPVLTLTKTSDPAGDNTCTDKIGGDDIVTYTLNYENTGDTQADNVVVVDHLDPNLDLVSGDGGVYDGPSHTLTWNLGDLGPAASGALDFQAQVSNDEPYCDCVENYAEIMADNHAAVYSDTVIFVRYPKGATGATVVEIAPENEAGSTVIIKIGEPEQNNYGAMFWQGGLWKVKNNYAHMYFRDLCTLERLKEYNTTVISGTTPEEVLNRDSYVATRGAYTYSILAKNPDPGAVSTIYTYEAVQYEITQPDGRKVLLNSRGSGNGTGDAHFNVYLEDKPHSSHAGTHTTAFRGDPVWYTYDGMSPTEAAAVTDTATGKTGYMPTKEADYFLDYDGGSDMGGLTYQMHTSDLNPSNVKTRDLGSSFVSDFRIKYNDGGGLLQEIIFQPAVLSEITESEYLGLTKTSDPYGDESCTQDVVTGEIITYTLEYTNPGGFQAFNATLVDHLDPGVAVADGGGGIYNGGDHTLTWNLGTLEPAENDAVVFTVEVTAGKGVCIEDYGEIWADNINAAYSDTVTHYVLGQCRHGDVNCNGTIFLDDLWCIFWRSLLPFFPSSCYGSQPGATQRADINCNGVISMDDVGSLLWHLFFELPIEPCDDSVAPHLLFTRSNAPTEPYVLQLGRVRTEEGQSIEVPILVERPAGLQVFGMKVSYPAELLIYEGVSTSVSTEDWAILDGLELSSGMVVLGGFNLEPLQSEAPAVIAKILFQVRKGIENGHGTIEIVDLMEDFSTAVVRNGHITIGTEIPEEFGLGQNYPNPFNPETAIAYTIPVDCTVRLEIYNVLGQKVVTLVDAFQAAGDYSVRWDAANEPAGVYVYRFVAGEFTAANKMVLMK